MKVFTVVRLFSPCGCPIGDAEQDNLGFFTDKKKAKSMLEKFTTEFEQEFCEEYGEDSLKPDRVGTDKGLPFASYENTLETYFWVEEIKEIK